MEARKEGKVRGKRERKSKKGANGGRFHDQRKRVEEQREVFGKGKVKIRKIKKQTKIHL